jgi:hypothetical protein
MESIGDLKLVDAFQHGEAQPGTAGEPPGLIAKHPQAEAVFAPMLQVGA